jgi:beta-mannosidase
MDTIERFTEPQDRNVFSYVMEKHQRNASANGRIVSYISQMYLYPSNLDKLVYASQLLQAQAMQYGVEHWRRNRGRCMGAVVWQLNDCWPVASWASIDYYGRWKALQYCAKRSYSPVMISCNEIGEATTRPYVIYERGYYDYETTATLCVNNETREKVIGTVKWALRDNHSNVIEKNEQKVTIEPLSALSLDNLNFNKTDLKNHLEFSFEVNGKTVSEGSVIFTAYKHYEWANPNIQLKIEGDEIVVKSDAYAKYVEVYSDDSDFILSDNFFDMEKGEKRIRVVSGNLKNLKVRSVFDIK